MPSIVDLLNYDPNAYGLDTETYNDNGETGLISIQIYGANQQHYFTSDDFSQSSIDVRNEICAKFFDWLESLTTTSTIAFFNMDYDVSQFLHYMICDAGYEYTDDKTHNPARGSVSILESDVTMYKVTLVTHAGVTVNMIDIAKFLTATTLNQASKEWLNDCKIELVPEPSENWLETCINVMKVKTFPKVHASPEQQAYAMKDAELTFRLYQQLRKSEVIEKSYITIAGRTIGHFKDYLHDAYKCTFDEWAYGTKDKEIVEVCTIRNESVMRESLRGGICRANRIGYFPEAHHLDAKSHYPSQCVKPMIPHGPVLEDKPSSSYTTLYFPYCYGVLKPNKLPYLQWKRNSQCIRYSYLTMYKTGEYVENFYLDGSYMLWANEWDLIKECYDIVELQPPKCYYIEMVENDILQPYVRELYKGKQNNTGTKKYYYKILLNSLYGKFLSRPDGMHITYAGQQRTKVEETDRKTYYLPLGSWIATGGRVDLMHAMLSIPKENVLYCDTDSMIYIGDKQPNVTLGNELGTWGVEHENVEAWIVGPKTYQERLPDGTVITKCAGLSKSLMGYVPFGELKEGLTVPCLKSHRDKETWAISLQPTTFQINTRAKSLRG